MTKSCSTARNFRNAKRGVAMALAAAIGLMGATGVALGGGVGVGTDQALGENSVAVGKDAKAHRSGAVAIGSGSEAMGNRALAAGAGAKAHGDDSVAVGAGSAATGRYSIALGSGARAERDNAIALGNLAAVLGDNAIALGARATVQRDNAIAIGNDASVLAANSVALGSFSVANGQGLNQQAWLVGGTAKGEVSVGAAGSERRVTNLAAGALDTDAVNVAQLRQAMSGTGGTAADAVLYDTSEHARVTLGGADAAAPVTLSNVAAGAIGTLSTDAVNGSQLYAMTASMGQALGGGAGVNPNGTWRAPAYSIGGRTFDNVGDALTNIDGRVTNIESSVTSVSQQISNGEVGLVKQDTTTGAMAVAADRNGTLVDMTGQDGARRITGVADGDISATSADAVNGSQIYALSQEMGAVNLNMTAHAQAMQDMATQANTYTDQRVGAALQSANSYTDGLVGTARRDASGGTAAAMAIAGLPQAVQYGRNLVGVSGATYDGQSAVALGVSRVSGSGRWVFKGSASTNTRGYYGVAVGAGMHW
ncbi:hypothetical protein AWB79_07495 [Caballeronia hypogeia]|uniref:YadA domain-containing protein n=1 Tax=Caballeronia hypogeia TaxID=1777140 RepID=A0A158DSL8_9BURK|nr:YadA-like family protein [Caballeronia hypogeia]SAK97621.1 hypothetical protein AWB79_07495 [Caballeronia hypogeia]